MIIPALLIVISYTALIMYLSKGIDRLEDTPDQSNDIDTGFSILVPFRDEAQYLPSLLESFSELDYPSDKFEIIMIDDASTDDSVSIIDSFSQQHPKLNISVTKNAEKTTSPKKDAVQKGIDQAMHPWIITTDADCLVPKTWLLAFDNKIKQGPFKMLVAPVTFIDQLRFIHKFQLLDFLSLQATTMGLFGMADKGIVKPFLCNGANLCYKKQSFIDVDGFKGNEHLASGDDVFLLEKMYQKFGDEVAFLKSKKVIVRTSSKNTFSELIDQRVRWASKTIAFKNNMAKMMGLLVFLANLVIVLMLFMALTQRISWFEFGLLFLLKFNIDFVLLLKASAFFEQKEIMKSYVITSLLFPFYTILITLLSLKKGYTWKGRNYS